MKPDRLYGKQGGARAKRPAHQFSETKIISNEATATQHDLTTQDGVVALMKSSKNEQEWNDNCDKVKAANGDYPGFWFPAIIMAGVLADCQARW